MRVGICKFLDHSLGVARMFMFVTFQFTRIRASYFYVSILLYILIAENECKKTRAIILEGVRKKRNLRHEICQTLNCKLDTKAYRIFH